MKHSRLGSVMSSETETGLEGMEANDSGAHTGILLGKPSMVILKVNCTYRGTRSPCRVSEFCRVLEENFGKGGAMIERMIAKKFYVQLEIPFVIYPGFR